jgi:predicted RNase H-like HicB family nuclease
MPGMTARDMVALPWTWVGPLPVEDLEHGQRWYEVRVVELPDFLVAADTPEIARSQAPEALEAFLASYESGGEAVPLPSRVALQAIRSVTVRDGRSRSQPTASATRLSIVAPA